MGKNAAGERPVPERRGVAAVADEDTWYGTLIGGEIERVADALERVGSISLVERSVTAAAVGGELLAPDGRWALLVALAGSEWVHLVDPLALHPLYRDVELGKRLACETGLKVLVAGYEDTSCATFVQLFEGRERRIHFESMGEGFGGWEAGESGEADDEDQGSATRFESDRHPPDWWRQFRSEAEVRDALLVELDAYVPRIETGSDEAGLVELAACDADVLEPPHPRRIDLVVFHPARSAKPNRANRLLAGAIAQGDAGAVRRAIAHGADPNVLPGTPLSPLSDAIRRLNWNEPDRVEVVRALISGGADVDSGGAGSTDPPLVEATQAAETDPAGGLDVMDQLIRAGADLEQQGRPSLKSAGGSPLFSAVAAQRLAAVMRLCEAGADLSARDAAGRTPLEAAKECVMSLEDRADATFDNHRTRTAAAIVEYLERAANGAVPRRWQVQLEADRAAADRERLRRLVAGEKLRRAFEGLASALKAPAKPAKTAVPQAVQAQPDAISLEPVGGSAGWQDAAARDRSVKVLEAHGYAVIGDYRIDAMPGVLVRGLIDRDGRAYAAVCEHPLAGPWVDLVRFYRDGSALTVTNAAVSPELRRFASERFRKMYASGAGVDHLLELFHAQPVPAGTAVEPVAADTFAARYETYYADQIAEMKAADW